MMAIGSSLLLLPLLAGVRGASLPPSSGYVSKIEMYVSFLLSNCLSSADREDSFSIRNPVYPLDVVDKLEEATMPKVDAYMAKKISAGKNNKCTLETAAVRREW